LFNIGPGLGAVGPTQSFAFIPTSGKVLLSFCMILGRLEFMTIFVLLLPDFWRR
jgi:trk system potassium uptake protein TrkH